LPVLRIDRLASVISILSASSVRVIRRSCSRSSSFTAMAMSHRAFEVFAHARTFGEDAGEDEGHEHGEPTGDRKARIEMKRMGRRRNRLADPADHDAEDLQHEQSPGDGLQALR